MISAKKFMQPCFFLFFFLHRSRSRSLEKPKMRALDVKSWKDFVNGGFHFDKFRRFKFDEAEEIKEKDRKTRTKKRHSDSRAENTNQNRESL